MYVFWCDHLHYDLGRSLSRILPLCFHAVSGKQRSSWPPCLEGLSRAKRYWLSLSTSLLPFHHVSHALFKYSFLDILFERQKNRGMAENQRWEKEREKYLSFAGSSPKCLQLLGQRHLLPYGLCISRNLDQKWKVGTQTRNSDMECGHLKW